jgi:uncharacterized protein (DUF488 family)
MKKPSLFTIGHSTRPLSDFMGLIDAYGVKQIVDVRSIPKSRHNPQFNEEALKESLKQGGVRYKHVIKLGGLRHSKKGSLNLGWRNLSFRGFADYMGTQEFSDGLDELMHIASMRETAIMCAEAVPWRCHRALIADALAKKGWTVRDIMTRTNAVASTNLFRALCHRAYSFSNFARSTISVCVDGGDEACLGICQKRARRRRSLKRHAWPTSPLLLLSLLGSYTR